MSQEPVDKNAPTGPTIAGVRFQAGGKVYTFARGKDQDIVPGDYVIVETAWGQQIGHVIYLQPVAPDRQRSDLKPILRRATGGELAQRQQMEEKAQEALAQARELTATQELPVKFVSAEYTLDGKRLTILYESEAKEDLQDLQHELGHTLRVRVELRQVGPRDRAKMLAGYGACSGLRCCSRFLSEFSPVSIRMAKAQGVSLTPFEITGMCGRLRCCLSYECEMYNEASQGMPKRKTLVNTPYGSGKVVDLLPLRNIVVVQIEDRRVEVLATEVQIIPKEQSGNG